MTTLAVDDRTRVGIPLDPGGDATCPLCHTVEVQLTNGAVGAGADWHCARCGQHWDSRRLATVRAYAAWLADWTRGPETPRAR